MNLQNAQKPLYAADTPYQILVCICDALRQTSKADIVIYGGFTDAAMITDRLRNADIFEHVFYVTPYYRPESNINIKYYVRELFNRNRGRESLAEAAPELVENNTYDQLLFCSGSPFTHDVKNYCCSRDAKSVLLEDGTGLYSGAVVNDMSVLDAVEIDGKPLSLKRKLVKQLVRAVSGKHFLFNIQEIHGFVESELKVLYPTILTSGIAIPSSAFDTLTDIFDVKDFQEMMQSDCVILMMPDDLNDMTFPIIEPLLRLIEDEVGVKAMIRSHPRSTMTLQSLGSRSEEQFSFSRGGLWELYCIAGAITDRTILIGFGSTAQTTPSSLAGMEPQNVFLSQLLPDECHAKGALSSIATNYLENAHHPERVFIPKDEREFIRTMKGLLTE